MEEDEDDGASQGGAPMRWGVDRLVDNEADIGGNGWPLTAFPQLPCLLTADREDCAVELFSLSTRFPPLPAAPAEDPGSSPLGPGREG